MVSLIDDTDLSDIFFSETKTSEFLMNTGEIVFFIGDTDLSDIFFSEFMVDRGEGERIVSLIGDTDLSDIFFSKFGETETFEFLLG